MKKLLISFALAGCLLLGAMDGRADQLRQLVGSSVTLARGLAWSSANDVWVFSIPKPGSSLYIFICNNNPTNSHTFTIAARQTPDTQTRFFTGSTGRWITDTIQGTMSPLAADTCVGGFVATAFAVRFSVQISSAASAAGTPDTFDMWVVVDVADPRGPASAGTADTDTAAADNKATSQVGQITNARVHVYDSTNWDRLTVATAAGDNISANTVGQWNQSRLYGIDSSGTWDRIPSRTPVDAQAATANLMTSSQSMAFNGTTWDRMRGSIPTGIDVSPPISGNSQRSDTSFFAINELTDPGTADEILVVTADGATAIHFDRAVITATAAASVVIDLVSDNGATCTGETETNLHISDATAATAVAVSSCTTQSTSINFIRVRIPANETIVVDLKGIFADASSEDGIMVRGGATQTTQVGATVFWYEQ